MTLSLLLDTDVLYEDLPDVKTCMKILYSYIVDLWFDWQNVKCDSRCSFNVLEPILHLAPCIISSLIGLSHGRPRCKLYLYSPARTLWDTMISTVPVWSRTAIQYPKNWLIPVRESLQPFKQKIVTCTSEAIWLLQGGPIYLRSVV